MESTRRRLQDMCVPEFETYYDLCNDLYYCKDVTGLFISLRLELDPAQWRLFIDSSKQSLKAVLLHSGNKYPSLPLAHSVQKKEDYDNVKELLDKINYSKFKWDVCGDFKMLPFLLVRGIHKVFMFPLLMGQQG